MEKLLAAYEHKKPQIVFEWNDPETEAQGWVVINSLRGGAAGGGTRMRVGLNRHEVESLAKTMEVKFTISGPAIGGAKSGINFNANDPRKLGVLERWYKSIKPLLKNYYGTGGDLNIDEVQEVIPITAKLDVMHPQEGILNGHLSASKADKIKIIRQLQTGVLLPLHDKSLSPVANGKYTVADMITGYGVSEAVKHYYHIYGGCLQHKRVIIQGWGNVAATAAYYQAQEGAKIVGIIDRSGGLISPDGFGYDDIKKFLLNKNGNFLCADKIIPFAEINEEIWRTGAEIFIPAAASRLVTRQQLETMIDNGLEVISCGANVPFADPDIFFGAISRYADQKVSVLPDFIANCGMARAFAFLMQQDADIQDTVIFADTSRTIFDALKNTHSINNSKTGIAKTAFTIALKKLF